MRAIALRLCAAGLAVLLLCVAVPAQQQDGAPDYTAWARVAERAEAAVEAGRASDSAFENLRAEVAGWRENFQTRLSVNESRLTTIRNQISALGPAPEEGATEPADIAARRADLTAQLERLSTPRRQAEEAFRRSDGIISEIDQIVRSRQTDALLKVGPTPLNPVLWPQALNDLGETLKGLASGVRGAVSTPSRMTTAQDNLPLILTLIGIALVLLTRSRRWVERIAMRLTGRGEISGRRVAGFVVSLGMIALPALGALALISALLWTGLYGPRGETVVLALMPMTFLIFGGRWLGSRLFPRHDQIHSPLGIAPMRKRAGRLYASVLGVLLAIRLLIDELATFDRYSPETNAVLGFPFIVLAGLLLWRLGRLLREHDPELLLRPSDNAFRRQLVHFLGRAAILIGLVGPVLAAAGYAEAAARLVYPAILTLAAFGLVSLLQDVLRAAYSWLLPGEQEGEGLIPTLLSFLLLVGALPVFALIWGARVTDLTEIWSRVRTGVSIGETTISPGAFLTLVLVFVIGYGLTRALQSALKSSVLPKTHIEPGAQTAIVSGVGYVGIFLAALFAITSAGIDLSNLAIVAGALSVGIGFGLQNIVSNFVSGIILLIERPISEGDWIEVGGQHGYVRKVSVRSTRIETFDRTDVIVPNSDFVSGTVTNYTRGNTVGRAIIRIGVAYGTDTRRVETILREVAEAHPMVLANPGPTIYFADFGASSLDFEIRAILRDVNFMLSVKSEIRHQIAERFTAENIEIPFAQTDLWLRNPEALAAGVGQAGQSPAADQDDNS